MPDFQLHAWGGGQSPATSYVTAALFGLSRITWWPWLYFCHPFV